MDQPQVIDYTVAKSESPSGMSARVRELILDGYQPWGSMATVVYHTGNTIFYQPMVKMYPAQQVS